MLIEHAGARPRVHPSAYVAPNAVLFGTDSFWTGVDVLRLVALQILDEEVPEVSLE